MVVWGRECGGGVGAGGDGVGAGVCCGDVGAVWWCGAGCGGGVGRGCDGAVVVC